MNLSNSERTRTTPDFLTRVAGIPAGRRTKWLVLVIWIIIMAVVSPFADRLASVEQNDLAQWLPDGAESLEVHRLQQQFPGGDALPAVVLYHRAGGLTEGDVAQIEVDRALVSVRVADTPSSDAIVSEDGDTAMFVVPLLDDGDRTVYGVQDIRELISGEEGLEVMVTGPAGFTTDLVEVFDGIDTTLLAASALVVAVLLLLIYRSPFLWLMPLLVVGFAQQTASGMIYGFVRELGMVANSQNTGILPILVFGVGTDYALLLIARYREELRRNEDKHDAMAAALRRAGPAIIASGATTIVGLLCLLFATMNSTQGLGPIGAAGIFSALVAMVTLLPALLVIAGRRVFWPFVPQFGTEEEERAPVWSAIGRVIAGRPRPVWAGAVVLLAVLSAGLIGMDTHLSQEDQFTNEPESITGQKILAESFPAGASAPATVLADVDAAGMVETAIVETPGVASVRPDGREGGLVAFAATLDAEPGSQEAFSAIERLRERVQEVSGANAMVGSPDAMELDAAEASTRDQWVVMPLVLLVVLVILCVLLRSLVMPLILGGTLTLSFAATVGASVLVFEHLLGFDALERSVILLSFVFLVALGIDYNIFLMSRVREEAVTRGTHEGTLRGLAVTGGVITSAGIVLAATFSVLMVMPLVMMIQLGFIVAFGVILETFLVRSILVPAIVLDLDSRIWWPSRLSRVTGYAGSGTTVPCQTDLITGGKCVRSRTLGAVPASKSGGLLLATIRMCQ
jgi:putative drug exporter of the RND superfamily